MATLKGNNIIMNGWRNSSVVISLVDPAVNYIQKNVREGGTVPTKNVIIYYRPSDGATITDTNTNTEFTSSIFTAHSGYYVKSIKGPIYTGTYKTFEGVIKGDTSELEELYLPNVSITGGEYYSLFSSIPRGIKKYMDVTLYGTTGGTPLYYRSGRNGTFIRNLELKEGDYWNLVFQKEVSYPINVKTPVIINRGWTLYPEKIVYTGTASVSLRNIASFRDLTIEHQDSVLSLSYEINSTPLNTHRDIVHIRVPNQLVDSYKMATNWSAYSDLIIPKDIDYYTDLTATAEDVYGNETITKVWWSCTAHYHIGDDLTDRTFTLKGVSDSDRFSMNLGDSPVSKTITYTWEGGVAEATLNHKEHLSKGFILKRDTPIGSVFSDTASGYQKEGFRKINVSARIFNPANIRAIACGATGHTMYSLNRNYCYSIFKEYGYLWDSSQNNCVLYNPSTGADEEANYRSADYSSLTDGQEICITLVASSDNVNGSAYIMYENAIPQA